MRVRYGNAFLIRVHNGSGQFSSLFFFRIRKINNTTKRIRLDPTTGGVVAAVMNFPSKRTASVLQLIIFIPLGKRSPSNPNPISRNIGFKHTRVPSAGRQRLVNPIYKTPDTCIRSTADVLVLRYYADKSNTPIFQRQRSAPFSTPPPPHALRRTPRIGFAVFRVFVFFFFYYFELPVFSFSSSPFALAYIYMSRIYARPAISPFSNVSTH